MKNYKSRRRQGGWVQWIPVAIAAIQAIAQNKQNKDQQEQADKQMAFQREMSNTGYARTVQDMQKAGLNPMLAYSQGPASSPGGAQAQLPQNAVGAGISSALQGVQMLSGMAGVEQTAAQTEQIKAATDKVRSETMEKNLNTARAYADLYKVHEDTRKAFTSANVDEVNASIGEVLKKQRELELSRDTATWSADVARRKAESQLTQLEIPKSQAEADFWRSDFGEATPWIKGLLQILRGASSARSLIQR